MAFTAWQPLRAPYLLLSSSLPHCPQPRKHSWPARLVPSLVDPGLTCQKELCLVSSSCSSRLPWRRLRLLSSQKFGFLLPLPDGHRYNLPRLGQRPLQSQSAFNLKAIHHPYRVGKTYHLPVSRSKLCDIVLTPLLTSSHIGYLEDKRLASHRPLGTYLTGRN